MTAIALFLNKAVLGFFAVAEHRENAAEEEYLGRRTSIFTGMERISVLLLN